MVEWIGVAAALPQLAKYGLSTANAVPDFARRVRKASVTQNQWTDQVSLLASLSQEVHKQPVDSDAISSSIISQLDADLNRISPVLDVTKLDASDGRFSRMKKKIRIVSKETEMSKNLSIVTQRTMLCSQLLILKSINARGQLMTTQPGHTISKSLAPSLPQHSITVLSFPKRHNMLMTDVDTNLSGMENTVQRTLNRIQRSSSSTIAISGLGGTGKTELAREIAHTLCATLPIVSIYWVDASTEPPYCKELRQLDQRASYTPVLHGSRQDIATLHSSLNSAPHGPKLLILDDADYTSCSNASIQSLLRHDNHCHVIITTRNRQFALEHVPSADLIELPIMTSQEGASLLLYYAGAKNFANDKDINQLVDRLDTNSFALKQVGLYMKSTGNGIGDCLALLKRDPAFLTILLARKHDGMQGSTVGTKSFDWLYSGNTLSVRNMDILPMLFVLSCLHKAGICTEIISMMTDSRSKRDALDVLKSYSLLIPTGSADTWMVPNLVAFATRAQLLHHPCRVRVLDDVLRLVNSTISSDKITPPPASHLWAHVASLLQSYIDLTSEKELDSSTITAVVQLAIRLCHYLVEMGRACEAVSALQQLIFWASERAKDLIPSFNVLRSKLGMALHSNGQYAAAELETRQVLRSQILTVGENDVNTLHSLNNLGVYHQDQGRFPMAESFHRKAFEMKRARFGAYHLETLLTLNNLALSLQSQKKYNEAEVFFTQALRGRKRLLPSNHPDTLVSMSNFAILKQLQGHFEQSQLLQEVALAGREQTLGSNHPETLKSKGNIALLLQRRGLHEQAIELLREVCQAYKDAIGRSHPEAIKSIRNLAIVLHQQNMFGEAEIVAIELLEILEEKHGKGHPETFATLDHLASLSHWQGKLEDAFDSLAWLYDIRNELLGKDHPDTINSRKYLEELEAEMVCSGQGSSAVVFEMI